MNSLRKYLFTGLIIAFFTFSMVVSAAEISNKDFDVILSGSVSPATEIRVIITDNEENFAALESEVADENGEYSINLSLPINDNGGTYRVYQNATQIGTIDIKSTTDVINLLNLVSGDSTYDTWATYAKRFGFEEEANDNALNKTAINPFLEKELLQIKEDIKPAFLRSVALSLLHQAERGDVLPVMQLYKAELQIDYDTDIEALTQAKKEKFVVEFLKTTWNDFQTFKESYQSALTEAKREVVLSGPIGGGYGSSSAAVSIMTPTNNQAEANQSVFSDLENYDWAKESIENLYERNIIQGVGNGQFSPGAIVKREEFVAMFVRLLGLEGEAEISFDDVNGDSWYAPIIKKAVGSGLIQGISNEYFGTGTTIKREDCAVLCLRIAQKIKGEELSLAETTFSDKDLISDYAKDAVSFVAQEGIMNGMGDNQFLPAEGCTRAMAAKIIWGLGEWIK